MLIKFQSSATAPFFMLADDAKPLIRGMGNEEKLEGSVSGENLREAKAKLESALKHMAQEASQEEASMLEEDPDATPPVDISVRAVPLLDMMRKALKEDSYVMWRPD